MNKNQSIANRKSVREISEVILVSRDLSVLDALVRRINSGFYSTLTLEQKTLYLQRIQYKRELVMEFDLVVHVMDLAHKGEF